MPNDEPATEDDSMGSEEQRSAQPAKPGETPVDTEHGTSSPASSNGEVSPESAEKDKPDAESESTAQKESDHDETDSKPRTWSDDFGEGMLALERPRDAEANIDTRPPAGEAVSFRSVTVAEIYAGQAIDSLTSALAAIEWTNFDEPLLDQIAEARRGFQYSRWVFWLISDTSPSELGGYGRTGLPSGINRIYGDCYVLGPSIAAVVFTFVLADDEAKRLDAALRDDAESRLDLLGPTNFGVKTVRDIKREQIRRIQDEVVRRCRSWLKDTMPGTLSATQEGLGPPTCALISLATGKPFDTEAEYMALLDLMRPYLVEKFVAHDFLFLIRPISRATDGGLVAAFNEADAVGRGWLAALGAAPEIFHEAITSLMVAEGLNAALLSFEPRLRDVRADLNQLDFEKASGSQVIALRNQLLGISRDLLIVCSDVTVHLGHVSIIWSGFSPLARVKPIGATWAAAETTADTKRRQLREVMESLQAQEAGLRELILVTSASTSETRNLELRPPQAEPLRILYLTAASRGDLRVDEEIRRVKAGVQAATHRDLVQIEHKPAATSSDLLDGLTRFKPHVVHFSGHADETVLVFDTGSDKPGPGQRVSTGVFARAISAVDAPPTLVVLNACRSEAQLAGLLDAVPLAVGMSDNIGDADAMAFAARFYATIADGQSVEGAYRVAKVAMELSGLPDADLPILANDPAVNPAEVVLVIPPQ